MQKKLQVFISSTFTDLQEERQAAVQAVLNAGHIPAGMELFKAADTSQKETIKKWIEESDVYMLVLGGRYGSIDHETGLSYTHWEYEYAGKLKKPRFAIVINDDALNEKVSKYGANVLERENYPNYVEFKKEVLSKISKFYSDVRDIKIAVLESLKEYEKDKKLTGWVSGLEIKDASSLMKDNYNLMKENTKLQKQVQQLQIKLDKENEIDGMSFEEVKSCLEQKMLRPDKHGVTVENMKGKSFSVYELFTLTSNFFASGITNQAGNDEVEIFLYQKVAPILMQFSLVEKVKLAGVKYQRIQTSKVGLKFLRLVTLEKSKQTV
ncbi:DUF4062 domain-containing protein [Bacillus thuringiensis]|uniref:DUF4062 domain-containing protein n=1 Tax=Bacillus thuringiensis TaxID=1428 RepID=UPI000A39F4D0|nr:DUF4062 domain-containing protein [Bacillus thuringiensis]MED3350091.1 DUF4062 domain-containing protein [Bacillus thuringiensis]MRB11305.1 DUF4062 domain-containing protein [Bacillus thuringiensis]OTW88945.1 hypothetical protein BK710_11305 [Bacillus thuringiensis serovar sumiyoshiensis]OTW95786.1 hypothetical protein BK711_20530 [Bacillus thuringiensis serovar fukuokaensis]